MLFRCSNYLAAYEEYAEEIKETPHDNKRGFLSIIIYLLIEQLFSRYFLSRSDQRS